MKTCPKCAEQIQEDAKVCRFCGRDFAGTGVMCPKCTSLKTLHIGGWPLFLTALSGAGCLLFIPVIGWALIPFVVLFWVVAQFVNLGGNSLHACQACNHWWSELAKAEATPSSEQGDESPKVGESLTETVPRGIPPDASNETTKTRSGMSFARGRQAHAAVGLFLIAVLAARFGWPVLAFFASLGSFVAAFRGDPGLRVVTALLLVCFIGIPLMVLGIGSTTEKREAAKRVRVEQLQREIGTNYQRGVEALKAGRYREARALLTLARSVNPGYRDVEKLLREANEYASSAEIAVEASPTPSASPDANKNKGSEEEERAIELCRRAALPYLKHSNTVSWRQVARQEAPGLWGVAGFRTAASRGGSVSQQVDCTINLTGSGHTIRLLQLFKESTKDGRDVWVQNGKRMPVR